MDRAEAAEEFRQSNRSEIPGGLAEAPRQAIQTYAEARAAALAHMSPWRGPETTPYAAPDGLEDGTDYLVPVGTEEDMSGEDAGSPQLDDMGLLVSKVTGEVQPASVLSERAKINRMRPVHENPESPVGNSYE